VFLLGCVGDSFRRVRRGRPAQIALSVRISRLVNSLHQTHCLTSGSWYGPWPLG
jgi:hypothetical protein